MKPFVMACGTVAFLGLALTLHLHAQSCDPIFDIAKAQISAKPDTGQLWPDALTAENVTVKLTGIAERETLTSCGLTTTQLSHKWSMQYTPPGGITVDATAALQSPASLSPRFFAQRGVYHIRLETSGSQPDDSKVATLRLDAVRADGWVSIGPDGRNPIVAGRVNTIAFDPNNPGIMYVGSARGGVWRSDNGALSWSPMTEHKGLPATLAIGSLLVTVNGRVYAGTGDPANGGYYGGYANGLYFSDDQGVTWAHVDNDPSCPAGSLAPSGVIARILPSSTSSTTVYVGASDGVFRTTDGKCWSKILSNFVFDIAIAKSTKRPSALYAAILENTNLIQNAVLATGDPDATAPTWSSTVAATGVGAPKPLVPPIARILLASSLNVVYALVAQSGGRGALGVFRKPNVGVWVQRNQPVDTDGNNRCDNQCSYSIALAANPTNVDDVYIGVVTAFRSTDGGQSWAEFNPNFSILSDQHAFAFHPTNPNLLFVGNDFGVQSIALDPVGLWTFQNTEMQTGLFLGLAVSASKETYRAAGGLQDAATQLRWFGRSWKWFDSGDGRMTAMDAVNPVLTYSQNDWCSLHRSSDGLCLGQADLFWSDPYRPGALLGLGVAGRSDGQLYYASQVDTASTANWGCIDPTPGSNPPVSTTAIAFGPGGGLYYVGNQAGAVYEVQVTAGSPSLPFPCQARPAVLTTLIWSGQPFTGGPQVAQGQVTGIAVDPQQPSSVLYATTGSYSPWRVVRLAKNAAGSWTATPIAGVTGTPGAFPNVPACQVCWSPAGTFLDPIAADPSETGKLYVGTDAGLMVGAPDATGNYQWSQDPDVPETWVTSVVARQSALGTNGIVRLSTFGRGIWERVRFGRNVKIPIIEPNVPYRGFINPLDRATVSVLPVDYEEERDGAMFRVSPTVKGEPSPFFIRQPRKIERGSGTAFVTVAYAKARAPLGLTTDGLDIERLDSKGHVKQKWHVDREMRWLRSDARSVVVEAELERPGVPASIHVRVKLSARGKFAVTTPDSVAVAKNADVSVFVPKQVTTPFGKAKFVGWVSAPSDARQFALEHPSSPLHWKARYRLAESARRQERSH